MGCFHWPDCSHFDYSGDVDDHRGGHDVMYSALDSCFALDHSGPNSGFELDSDPGLDSGFELESGFGLDSDPERGPGPHSGSEPGFDPDPDSGFDPGSGFYSGCGYGCGFDSC